MRRGMKNNNQNNSNNNNRKRPPPPPPPLPIIGLGFDGVAKRKRRKITAKGNNLLTSEKIVEIISYLDQDSLMNLSLVSKQSHTIICNEPGIKNKIIPVFEVAGLSAPVLYQMLRRHFSDEETAEKLQRYQIMRFDGVVEGDLSGFYDDGLELIMGRNVKMNSITSLQFSSRLSGLVERTHVCLFPYAHIADVLPKLCEIDFSNIRLDKGVLQKFSMMCPLLKKVTYSNRIDIRFVGGGYDFSGYEMRLSNNLKEINMDGSWLGYNVGNYRDTRIFDLDNHQEIFIFRYCCKSLERVSIRDTTRNDYTNECISQNAFIKFVRNAPKSLRWFRSDLTPGNMAMLRIERPGIELVN
jgi:hypothetical protein